MANQSMAPNFSSKKKGQIYVPPPAPTPEPVKNQTLVTDQQSKAPKVNPQKGIASGPNQNYTPAPIASTQPNFNTPNGNIRVNPPSDNNQPENSGFGLNSIIDAGKKIDEVLNKPVEGLPEGTKVGSPAFIPTGVGGLSNTKKVYEGFKKLKETEQIAVNIQKFENKGNMIAEGIPILEGKVAEAASGKITGSLGNYQPPINTKIAKLLGSYISKLNPSKIVAGLAISTLIGTGAYTAVQGPTDKNNLVTTSLPLAIKSAKENGDWERASELNQLLIDTNEINSAIPFTGFTQVETNAAKLGLQNALNEAKNIEKGKENALLYDAYKAGTTLTPEKQKQLEEAHPEIYFERRDAEAKKYEEEKRQYYAQKEAEQRNYDAKQREQKLADQANIEEYFKQRDEEMKKYQAERDAYYEQQRKQRLKDIEDSRPSKLNFRSVV